MKVRVEYIGPYNSAQYNGITFVKGEVVEVSPEIAKDLEKNPKEFKVYEVEEGVTDK